MIEKYTNRIFNKNNPAGKGLRTAYQAVVGLLVAVWAVPGVQETVLEHGWKGLVAILLAVGVPSGVVSYIQNKLDR